MTQAHVRMSMMVTLLAIYILPISASAVAALSGGLSGDSFLGSMLMALIFHPDNPLAILQRLLLPLTAAVTVAALWTEKNAIFLFALLSLSVLGAACAALLWFVLNDPEKARLAGGGCDDGRRIPQGHEPVPERHDPGARHLPGRPARRPAHLERRRQWLSSNSCCFRAWPSLRGRPSAT